MRRNTAGFLHMDVAFNDVAPSYFEMILVCDLVALGCRFILEDDSYSRPTKERSCI